MRKIKNLKTIALKLSYPLLGNLSNEVQKGLERKTDFIYDSEKATKISCLTNMALGGILLSTGNISSKYFSYLAIESGFRYNRARSHNTLMNKYHLGNPISSFPGKIVSFPLELYLYWKKDVPPIIQKKILRKLHLIKKNEKL